MALFKRSIRFLYFAFSPLSLSSFQRIHLTKVDKFLLGPFTAIFMIFFNIAWIYREPAWYSIRRCAYVSYVICNRQRYINLIVFHYCIALRRDRCILVIVIFDLFTNIDTNVWFLFEEGVNWRETKKKNKKKQNLFERNFRDSRFPDSL